MDLLTGLYLVLLGLVLLALDRKTQLFWGQCAVARACSVEKARDRRHYGPRQAPGELIQSTRCALYNQVASAKRSRLGYLSELGECLGDHALAEIRRFQMPEKPPSTANSTPFT